MWFTGRVSGAATVLVLEPSHVTGRLDEVLLTGAFAVAGAFTAGAFAEEFFTERADDRVAGPVFGVAESATSAAADGEGAGEEDFAVGVVTAATPSSWRPVPLPHAVRESAASTTVVAAPTRRVREVRSFDM